MPGKPEWERQQKGSRASSSPGSVAGNRGGKGRGGRGSKRRREGIPEPARLAAAAGGPRCPAGERCLPALPETAARSGAAAPRGERGRGERGARRGIPVRDQRTRGLQGAAEAGARRSGGFSAPRLQSGPGCGMRWVGVRDGGSGAEASPLFPWQVPDGHTPALFPWYSCREHPREHHLEESSAAGAAKPRGRSDGLRFGSRLRRRQHGVMDAPHAGRQALEQRC